MSVIRDKMKRKYQQAIGTLENTNEHLMFLFEQFSEGKEIAQIIIDVENEQCTSDKYRYAKYLIPVVQVMEQIDLISDIIQVMLDEYKGLDYSD